MKKYLALMTASSLISASLMGAADFYMGYEHSVMTAENAANQDRVGLDESIKGMGFGVRIYTEVNPELDIGGEFGGSLLETRSSISGSILHGQFLLKYHMSDAVTVFGGLGVAMRGTPEDTNTSAPSDYTLLGGMGSIGISFATDANWRIDATYHYISFSGKIDAVDETVTTSLLGLHVGRTFELN